MRGHPADATEAGARARWLRQADGGRQVFYHRGGGLLVSEAKGDDSIEVVEQLAGMQFSHGRFRVRLGLHPENKPCIRATPFIETVNKARIPHFAKLINND